MQKIIIPFLISLFPLVGGAQSLGRTVVGASGATYSNGNSGLSVTIGEICVQRYSNNANVVTEGFLQPGQAGGATQSLSLTSTLANDQTRLAWLPSQEQEGDHFEIERSADGRNFAKWQDVMAAGNGTPPQVYHTTDASPGTDITYYRVKQANSDQQPVYSSVVSVKRGDAIRLQVYPNPATTRVVTALTCSAPRQLTLDLYDGQGKVLLSKQVNCVAGVNSIEWDLQHFAAGTYLVRSRQLELPVIKIAKE